MGISEAIEQQVPYLRRYARAVTGSTELGDRAVEAMLEELFGDLPGTIEKPDLFKRLDQALKGPRKRNPGASGTMQGVSPKPRRALLLTAQENFTVSDAGKILGVGPEDAQELLNKAELELQAMLHSRVFIIEDEPLIAASLSQLVTSLGHTVAGIAVNRHQAVEAVLETRPDLILADIQLADGSQGTDAVRDIWSSFSVPVIFITAYPERMLTGAPGEPAYLIPKPFRPAEVRAVITQALFIRSLGDA